MERFFTFLRITYYFINIRDEIFNHIENCTKNFLTEDLIDKLFDKGCWCAPLKTHKEVNDDPQVKHMQMFSSFNHEKYGEVTTVSPPVKMSETPARISKPVPLIGEHGYEILEEFGYTVSEIEEFEKNKVITVERISDE